jgi:protein-S-isoprenylcysteine O-methyltransferase Ste14
VLQKAACDGNLLGWKAPNGTGQGRHRARGKEGTVKEFLWIIAGMWIVFMGWLFIPALVRGGARPQKISPTYVRRSLLVFAIVIVVFIAAGREDPEIFLVRFLPDTILTGLAGVILTVLGLGFSAYARLHLGRNWSSMVMIKEGHQLIKTGPYSIVRNPMYTGLLTAYCGLVIALGILAALAALVIVITAIWMKIKAEEELLEEQFGWEYNQYRRDVKALIPWLL